MSTTKRDEAATAYVLEIDPSHYVDDAPDVVADECFKAGWDACAKEKDAEIDRLRAQLARLSDPHAKDCAFLLSGKRDGRWDCDCDASVVKELEAAKERIAMLERIREINSYSSSYYVDRFYIEFDV